MAASAAKFVELSMVPDLAVELAAQMNAGVGDTRRLQELGMVAALAAHLRTMINSGVYNATKLQELGMVGPLAAVVVASGGTPTPTPPVFTTQPSISPSSGSAGVTTFTANDGVITDAISVTRRWILNGSTVGTGAPTYLPTSVGTLALEVDAIGPGGETLATSASVSVIGALAELTFDNLTAEPGAVWGANIVGMNPGSTVTATASDGTVLTQSGTVMTGRFPAGSPTISNIVETATDGRTRTSGPITLTIALKPLNLAPMIMTSPNVINVPTTGGTFDLLAGFNKIVMPASPVTGPLTLHGQNRAAHFELIKGELAPPRPYDPSTMKLLSDGTTWAFYTQLGFTGATGGTFDLTLEQVTSVTGLASIVARNIPWNADGPTISAYINAAIEAALLAFYGSTLYSAYGFPTNDHIFAVEGTGIGGPWKLVPGNNASLGRVTLNMAGLTGSPVATTRTTPFSGASVGLTLKQWNGVGHIEGLWSHTIAGDNIVVQNQFGDAILQLGNVRCHTDTMPYHFDWYHPDGLQNYLGAAKIFMENVDLWALGGNAWIDQSNETVAPSFLQKLHDRSLRNVYLRGTTNDTDKRRRGPTGACGIMEDDYEQNARNNAGLDWVVSNAFAERIRGSTGLSIPVSDSGIGGFISHYVSAISNFTVPVGLKVAKRPPSGGFADPAANQCGLGYAGRAYTGAALPAVTQRIFPISALTYDGTKCTVTVESTATYTTGQKMTIAGGTVAAYNGIFDITVISATQFTYVPATAPASSPAVATTLGLRNSPGTIPGQYSTAY